MGVNLISLDLPKLPFDAMTPLLTAEAAAAFDELTTTGRDKLLTEQGPEDWPNDFRVSRFYPAVEYIQANRARTLAVQPPGYNSFEFATLDEAIDYAKNISRGNLTKGSTHEELLQGRELPK